MININNKKFKALSNSENGQISEATIFHYYQDEDIIWANYAGGEILRGSIIGTIKGSSLNFVYQHLNIKKDIMTGRCTTQIEIEDNGKYRLIENWQWTSGDLSKGTSILIEI